MNMTRIDRELETPQVPAPVFIPWPKIPRLNRDIVITEKLDGTNAAVHINDDGTLGHVQSRSRIITPESDNYGFARYVHANKETFEALGPGTHFGEWWGNGIQCGYGLSEKRFSLFNTHRWNAETTPKGLYVVPVLYQGPFDQTRINIELDHLKRFGSVAAPDFMKPEGIIVYHTAANQYFKVLIENDEGHKGN